MRSLLLLLAAGSAWAEPQVAPPSVPGPSAEMAVVRVRPLAAPPRPVLKANYSKAELIAAMGVTTTLAVQEIAETALPDGDLVATPPVFECKVTGGLVRVTYVREGFVTEGLPTLGACGEGPGAVPFRIEVAPVPEET